VTSEQLEFSAIPGPIPNRGLLQPDINMFGLTYQTAPTQLQYSQTVLLNFNGLTHAVLVIWPVLVSAYLLWLAGQPGWGQRAGQSDAGDRV